MATNNKITNNTKKITPFMNFCIQNFPFIEATYDAIDNYDMWCKLVAKMNEVINNENTLGVNFNEVLTAFNNLQSYVNNFFDTLDVQDEVNSKLDDLVNDGTLEKLINNEILQDLQTKVNNNTTNITNNTNLITQANWQSTGMSIHISIDDVENCLQNLINNIYDSLFDEPFFGMLNDLHNRYNACFSLYVFTDKFNAIQSTKYINDFRNNAKWLKIGYHALNSSDNLSSTSMLTFRERYNNFVNSAIRICGTNEIIDRVPRLANYVCPIRTLNGATGIPCGIIGLLDSEDDRVSYLHNSITKKWIKNTQTYFDNITKLFFIRTQLRIENSTNLSSDLINLLNNSNGTNNIEIFTHEWYLYNNNTISNKNQLETICQFANNYNIPFNFVQNKLPDLTGAILQENYTIASTNINNVPIGTNYYPITKLTDFNMIKKNMQANSKGAISFLVNDINVCAFPGYFKKGTFNALETHTSLNNLQIAICELVSYNGIEAFINPNGYKMDTWIDLSTNSTENRFKLQNDTELIYVAYKLKEGTMTDDNLKNIYSLLINIT